MPGRGSQAELPGSFWHAWIVAWIRTLASMGEEGPEMLSQSISQSFQTGEGNYLCEIPSGAVLHDNQAL